MADNANQFILDISDWVKQAKEDGDKILRKVCLDLFGRVILDTPVDTGRLRGAWLCTIGAPATSAPLLPDPSGAAPKMASTVATAKMGDTVYLVNNVSYAPYVEFGTSRMAPRAMVGRNVQIFQSTLNKAAQSTKSFG